MKKVLLLLAEGFEEIEAVTVVDVLRRGGVEVVVASIGEGRETRGAHGIAVKADALFSEAAAGDFDAIVLPGGGPGTERLRNKYACHDVQIRFLASLHFMRRPMKSLSFRAATAFSASSRFGICTKPKPLDLPL